MTQQPVSRQILGLIGWLILCFAAAAIGAVASANADSFYVQLTRPDWAPPPWLFAPVWTLLYTLMAVAAWLVWRESGFKGASVALGLFVVQLGANALWTWIFFAWRQGGLAFAEIVLLLGLIIATAVSFRRHNSLAAALLLPYLAWVLFATALTLSTWRLNPHLL